MKIISKLLNLFSKKNKPNPWNRFDPSNPPNVVVLATCYTYDCGWVMDTVWWDSIQQSWIATGTLEPTKTYLEYSHWRFLPDEPPNSSQP